MRWRVLGVRKRGHEMRREARVGVVGCLFDS